MNFNHLSLNTQSVKPLELRPKSYSKFKTVQEISNAIEAHPAQDCNNLKAYMYSVEFDMIGNPAAGTLSEMSTYFNHGNFLIKATDGELIVLKSNNQFVVR